MRRLCLIVAVPAVLAFGACVQRVVHDPEDHLLLEAEREIHRMHGNPEAAAPPTVD